MRDQIIIRMTDDVSGAAGNTVSWLKLSDSILQPSIDSGSLSEAAENAIGYQVVVLIPGRHILQLDVDVPTQNKQRMMKAIRYANEEDLASDVDTLHFAVGKIGEKNKVSVAIVDQQQMDIWQKLFAEAGLPVDFLLSELQMLPQVEASLSILIEPEAAIVRADHNDAFVVEVENFELLMGLWFNERKKNEEPLPVELKIWRTPGAESLPLPKVFSDIEVVNRRIGNMLEIFVHHPLNLDAAINLLQGDYSRSEQLGKIWRPWRAAAAIAGVLFVLQLVLAIGQSSSLESQSIALKAEAKKIFKTTFPEVKRIVNPKAQMKQKLAELTSGGKAVSVTFLAMIAETGAAFKQTPGVKLKNIRFKNATLDVELEAPNYQVLDELKQKLTKKGKRRVEIQSAVTRNNVIQGRLQIKGIAS